MQVKRLNPRPAVQKWLYAVSRNERAFTGCTAPVAELASTGKPFVTSNIAHVIGASEYGPRGQAELSEEDRRSAANLILLCQRHATLIDVHKEDYPEEVLLRMKHLHESQVSKHAGIPRLATLPNLAIRLHGRDSELALADRWVESPADPVGGARLLHIHGVAGIGKSTLAIQIANRVGSSFPDGVIYVRTPDVADSTFDIVTELLAAFDLSALPEPVPSRQQLATLRNLVEGKRMLIVVDGDPTEGCIRQVLTLSSDISVICSSRNRMSGLADTDMTSINLEALSMDATQSLMRSIIPDGRTTNAQLARLAAACSGHPLATRIIAARISSRPVPVNLYESGFSIV